MFRTYHLLSLLNVVIELIHLKTVFSASKVGLAVFDGSKLNHHELLCPWTRQASRFEPHAPVGSRCAALPASHGPIRTPFTVCTQLNGRIAATSYSSIARMRAAS